MKNENLYEYKNKENIKNVNLNFLNNLKSALSDPIFGRLQKTIEKCEKEPQNSKKQLDLRIKQLSLAKIAINIHNLDPLILIKSHMDLANLYSKLFYTQQSFEHYRQALKTHSIYFKDKEELELKFIIFSKLIDSCYLLKSYNQTLSYIQNYYNLLNKYEGENISSLNIDLIHAKTLYALNDFEKSEKQFLIALNMLNKEINLIVKLNEDKEEFNRNNFIFENKTKILDFLFKIKIKEDNIKREQLELINQILELCEKGENEKILNKELLFQMKSKYILKKIELIQEESKINIENMCNEEIKEINFDGNIHKNNLFIQFIQYLLKIFKQQKNLISKNNKKILQKISNLCKKNISKIIQESKFQLALDLIQIIQILDIFFFGDFSKNKAKNNYIQAFLILKAKQNIDFDIIEKLLKKVLKISRHFKMDILYKKSKDLIKSLKNNEIPDFDYKFLNNYTL